MKKINLMLLVVITLISCKLEAQVSHVIVTGKIENLATAQITILSQDQDCVATIALDDDGSFEEKLDLKTGVYYMVDENQNATFIYLDNGAGVNVKYDSKDHKNSLKISGKWKNVSKYLSAKGKKIADTFSNAASNPYELEPADYKVKMQEFKKNLENLLLSTKGIPSDFRVLEKRDINCIYITMLAQYSWGPQADNLPEGFLSEVNDFDINNEADYEFSIFYRIYLMNCITRMSYDIEETGTVAANMGVFKAVEVFTNDIIKNRVLFDKVSTDIVRTPDIDAYYNMFMRTSTSEVHKNEITKIYNELNSLSKGHSSPKFSNYENFNGGTTSLDDFKGKYVFIDLWATWCGACIKEFPSIMKLEEEYHGKNIVFVGISLDEQNNHDKWKKLIQKKGLKGIQLLADKAVESEFAKAYKVHSIPRFIILDPDGNILTSNAPFPSDPKLKELLNGLNL